MVLDTFRAIHLVPFQKFSVATLWVVATMRIPSKDIQGCIRKILGVAIFPADPLHHCLLQVVVVV